MKKEYSVPTLVKAEIEKSDVISTSFKIDTNKQKGLGDIIKWDN